MKKILSLLLALALCAGLGVPALAAGFTDVPPGHYAAGAIDGCVARGIVSGYADGSFKPSGTLTNAQFCVMISRAFCPEVVKEYAADSFYTERFGWYGPYLFAMFGTAERSSLLEGTSFQWDATDEVMAMGVTRYDMAQIAANVMLAGGKTVSDAEKSAAQTQIRDWASIPEEYREAVAACYALGILGGRSDGTFGGSGFTNRAQGCAVIDRISRYVQPGTLSRRLAPKAPVQPTQPSQPSQSTQPSRPVQPAADPAQFPEIRCLTCGYLMRQAGSPEMDYNNGGANGAVFLSCELCNAAYICNQCSKNREDAAFNMHRHLEVCASGGTMVSIDEFYSPSYRSSVYYQRLKNVTLTGDYRRDLLAVAESQIGYVGGRSADRLDGSGGGKHTEYNWALSAYGESKGAWCSEFASWCARQANIPFDVLHCSAGASPASFGGAAYAWSDTVFAGGGYMPQTGDLMLVCHSNRAVSATDYMDHTTIVESVSWDGNTVTVTVIEGNANNMVRRDDYIYNVSRGFCGYFVAPDYP